MIIDNNELVEFVAQSSRQVLPMAHLLFKVLFIFRIGCRSNFAAQDVLVVSIILTRKKFNIAESIMKNMLEVFEGKSGTGLH